MHQHGMLVALAHDVHSWQEAYQARVVWFYSMIADLS